MAGKLGVAVLLTTVVVFACFADPSSSTLQAEQSDETNEDIPSQLFEGKIVLLRIDRSSAVETKESSKTLINASIQEIGGRYFIIGDAHVPDDPDYAEYQAMREVSAGIAWERVSEFQAFTEEQYNAYINWWKEYRNE